MPRACPLLSEFLRVVARRYRVPDVPKVLPGLDAIDPATALAFAIEHARESRARAEMPGAGLRRYFLEALARLIQDAMREDGDPVFQAMALRHQTVEVREYASLVARAAADRRKVRAAVNAIAHPGKLQNLQESQLREGLAQLHAGASSGDWAALNHVARQLLTMLEAAADMSRVERITRLLEDPALGRLQRIEALACDGRVRQYEALWRRNGPRAGSAAADKQGAASRQRGSAMEAAAAQALAALSRRFSKMSGASYRVVTSMRVPASLLAGAERAKGEWDAVMLRQASHADAAGAWDACLLVEAKASADAATTDLPRLLRGLRLLAGADEDGVYPFRTREGVVPLRGGSLRALPTAEADLHDAVIYCTDAAADAKPRLLGAAGRMQLLSAQASLDFAVNIGAEQRANPGQLEPVWRQLIEADQWLAVLHQYQTLRRGRELMVHIDDLVAAAP